MHTRLDTTEGFTLIELMTAVSIFLVIMTISMGSILGVFDSERKSSSLRAVMSNLNFAIEAMSKDVRFGRNYHCNTATSLPSGWTTPRNCSPTGEVLLSYLSSNNLQTTYRLSGQEIQKTINGGVTWIGVTPPEVVIEDLDFYVLGAVAGDDAQPKVLVRIDGYSGTGKARSDFVLQTLISQRALDI